MVYETVESVQQLIGLWHDITPGHGVYFGLEEDGSFGVYLSSDVERGPYDWGTDTLDGPVLILANAEDSACAGATGVWDTAVSEGGDQAHFTFIEDDCALTARQVDWTIVRHAP